MIKKILKNAGSMFLGVCFLLYAADVARAQDTDAAGAKAALEQGKAADESQDYVKAASFYQKAVELDPGNIEAHNSYIQATRVYSIRSADEKLPELERQKKGKIAFVAKMNELAAVYEKWAAKDPKNPIFPWAISQIYIYNDFAKVEQYARKAVNLDPKFGPAYETLALTAEARGDQQKSQEYLKKVTELDPQNPAAAFSYANSLRNSDPALYRAKSLELAKRFPQDRYGAMALSALGYNSENTDEKIAYLEQLKSAFPPDRFVRSRGGMMNLFSQYLKTDTAKALKHAKELHSILTSDSDKRPWQERIDYLNSLIGAQALNTKKEFGKALLILDKIKPLRSVNNDALFLAKADAWEGSGQAEKAYQEVGFQRTD